MDVPDGSVRLEFWRIMDSQGGWVLVCALFVVQALGHYAREVPIAVLQNLGITLDF